MSCGRCFDDFQIKTTATGKRMLCAHVATARHTGKDFPRLSFVTQLTTSRMCVCVHPGQSLKGTAHTGWVSITVVFNPLSGWSVSMGVVRTKRQYRVQQKGKVLNVRH